MDFENNFAVSAPAGTVFDTLLDIERVTPCMPGASVLERVTDTNYKVSIKVKVGPMSMTYKGDVEILDTDPATHSATMRVKAKESRGQGTANADVAMAMHQDGPETQVTMTTTVKLSGKAASMGRGVIGDVSAALVSTFAANLQEMLAADGASTDPAPDAAGEAEPSAAASAGAAAAPPPPRPTEAADAELPVGKILGSVVAGRLQDPRTRAVGLIAAFAVVLLMLRRRRDG